MKYQPTWIQGEETAPGRRDAAGRYQAIADYLRKHPIGKGEPFTCLDFGAYGGYFCQRLTEDFGASCTAVDDYKDLTPSPGVTVVNERLTADQLARLGSFDVVLALSVLHHVLDWRRHLDALLSAGTVLFIEVASPGEDLPEACAHGDSQAIAATVADLGGAVMTWTPGYDARHLRPL